MASTPAPKKALPIATKPAAAKKVRAGASALVAIYALSDPETGEIRYIGKANNPRARLKSHIRDSRRRNTPVCCWIKKLAQHGATPTMSILEWTDDWIEAERRLIAKSRRYFEDKGDFERFATMDYLALRLGQVSIETQMRVAKAWGFCPEGQTS